MKKDLVRIDPRFAARERQPGLDLLRAIAIVMVVIYHCGIFGFALPYSIHRFGWIGVDLFFVLSGYLIGGQLLGYLALGGKIQFARFYARRALRILPAYFVILAIYFWLPSWREFPEMSPLWKFLLSVQNIGLHGGTAFSHAWSLAVEDQFYLLLPIVILFVSRSSSASMVAALFVFLGGLTLRGFLAWQQLGLDGSVSPSGFQSWIYYPTWTRLDPLVCGVVLAGIERYRSSWWEVLVGSAGWIWLPSLLVIAYGLYLGEGDLSVATCVWQFPLIGLGMAGLLICSLSPRMPLARVRVPGATLLASLAYSVYLSHKLVIHLVIDLCSRYGIALSSALGVFLVEVLIYVGGAILFWSVERPFLVLRSRLTRRDFSGAG